MKLSLTNIVFLFVLLMGLTAFVSIGYNPGPVKAAVAGLSLNIARITLALGVILFLVNKKSIGTKCLVIAVACYLINMMVNPPPL